jgi:hypothetical protein
MKRASEVVNIKPDILFVDEGEYPDETAPIEY